MPLRDQSLAELWRASTNLLKWTHKNNRKIYSLLYECVLCVLDELWGVRHFRNQTTPVFMYTADDVDFYVNIMRACVKIIKSLLMKILMGKNLKILCWHWHWYCVPFILIWKSADGSRICEDIGKWFWCPGPPCTENWKICIGNFPPVAFSFPFSKIVLFLLQPIKQTVSLLLFPVIQLIDTHLYVRFWFAIQTNTIIFTGCLRFDANVVIIIVISVWCFIHLCSRQ